MSTHPKKIKHYEIVAELAPGSGALLADDTTLNRKVVVKLLRPEALASQADLGQFRHAVKRLSLNPAVQVARTVELLQVKTDTGAARYLVREYRDGMSLEATLERKSALAPDEAAHIMATVTQVLAAMHEAGTAHGNLCASNVILDVTGKIQLVDYALPTSATNRPYIAPEILRGGRPDHASDIFSLGVLFCRLLTGQFPPASGLPESALVVAGPLGELLGNMLQADPARRPASAAQVARHLQNPTPAKPAAAPAPRPTAPAPPKPASATAPKQPAPLKTAAPVKPEPPKPLQPQPPAPAPAEPQPSPAAAAPADEVSKTIDWERVIRLVAQRPAPEPERQDTRKARIAASDVLQPLPSRPSEAAAPRADKAAAHRSFYRAVTGIQLLFVTWAVGFLLFTISRQALQGGASRTALSSVPSSATQPAVYTAGTTATQPAQPAATPPPPAAATASASPAPASAEMRPVPGGEFVFFNAQTNKRERVHLDAFEMDRYETTNAEFLKFTQETGYISDGNWQRYFLPGMERYPVAGVSFKDASEYAKWVGKRLPTSQEWQKACGGKEGHPFPWGLQFDPMRCAWMATQKPVQVDAFPEGQSAHGLFNMSGNVWEWVTDTAGGRRFLMGGSYNSDGLSLGTLARLPVPADGFRPTPDIGFRCVK